ncbi:MAG: amidohydrolase family protein [Kiritimatiellae bacterium]|nr:amidohydrolase family protein [Kiritimatiellia bacterium]
MSADDTLLIRNARVWPAWDAELIPDGSILVVGERIERVGRFTARARTVIDAGGALAMPGFIHAHVHLCQTLFRGLAEDLPLLRWLREYIWPLEAAHTDATLEISARLAAAEMIRSGTTGFASIETVRGTEVVLDTISRIGLPGLVGHCLMDETGGYPPLAVPIDEALATCDALVSLSGDRQWLRPAVAPRFALSCSEPNLVEAAAFARDRGLRLHTHASEQLAEIEWVRAHTGRDNIAYLRDCGIAGPDVLLAHCVHADRTERAILADSRTHVVHCPSANWKLGSGIAPVPEMLAEGVAVALGADGAACNNRLDMFAEMRLAGLAQAVRRGPGALPARQIVRLATEGGAAALGWGGVVGRLEPGWRADVVLIELDDLAVLPASDPATAVVYSAHPGCVSLTMAAGRILYENGQFTTIDAERLPADARDARRHLMRRAGLA